MKIYYNTQNRNTLHVHVFIKTFVLIFPPILCCLSYIGFVWWERGALPGFRPTIYDREIEELSLNDRGVRVHGWADTTSEHILKKKDKNTTYIPLFRWIK